MGDPLIRRDLLRRGVTDDDVRRALRTGQWRPLRPGAYLEHDDPLWRDSTARHGALVTATFPLLTAGTVLCGVSAAVRHGLPVGGVTLRAVHVVRDQPSGGRAGRWLHVHTGPIPDHDVVTLDGLPTTSVARTVVDVARTGPFETAVAIADAALHRALVTPDELGAALLDECGRHGIGRARAVVAFADSRADGPGESRSRVRMDELGVAPPILQHRFDDALGRHVGTVDFWWPDAGLIGEFDGMEKYGRSLRPGESIGDAVRREKIREDALRSRPDVRGMVRWTWDEIADFAPVAARLPQRRPPAPFAR